jgi:hypothetical protein
MGLFARSSSPVNAGSPFEGTKGKGNDRPLTRTPHGWFIEGFDWGDLQDTKALLDKLAGPGTWRCSGPKAFDSGC